MYMGKGGGWLCPRCAEVPAAPEPLLLVGFLRLERPGDLDWDEVECVECASPCTGGVWYGVMGDGTLYGPLCSGCATTE